MRYACIYSIVRFAPFADTEEFANVGIILTVPAIRRLANKRWPVVLIRLLEAAGYDLKLIKAGHKRKIEDILNEQWPGNA